MSKAFLSFNLLCGKNTSFSKTTSFGGRLPKAHFGFKLVGENSLPRGRLIEFCIISKALHCSSSWWYWLWDIPGENGYQKKENPEQFTLILYHFRNFYIGLWSVLVTLRMTESGEFDSLFVAVTSSQNTLDSVRMVRYCAVWSFDTVSPWEFYSRNGGEMPVAIWDLLYVRGVCLHVRYCCTDLIITGDARRYQDAV